MESIIFSKTAVLYLEYIGLATGLVCVWLNIQKNIWGWVFAIISALCYIIVFGDAQLYADMGLQVVFIGSGIYGIWQWRRPEARQAEGEQIAIKNADNFIYYLIFGAIMSLVLGFILASYTTDASLPWADSCIAAYSLVAQYLMARRFRQNWILWIGINVLSIGVYAIKGLWPTTLLYTVFLVMAFYGHYTWRAKPQNT